ncbi:MULTISPECIES: hypothetical protein [Burkholderia cepacia complex]|uniref:hypothetical protein n=1 Tax=Burkholderia cepacia complex TaxID=87882 RepID=UPI001B95C259|nr:MULTISPECIES: hypothetical protein [Burkholderia cepacia complex]MBR8093842.1 hypothetical protein [Burkholderia cenocepacia]
MGLVHSVRLMAPPVFSAYNLKARSALLKFVRSLCAHVAHGRSVRIDFSRVKLLNPCGTLLFVSELYRLLEHTQPKARVSCNYPKEPVVEELFQHIGLLGKLQLPPRKTVSHERVKYWTLHCGTEVDLTGIETLYQRLLPTLGDELSFNLMGGIKEAVTNSVHHAYIADRGDGVHETHRGWWLFAQQRGDDIDISICDLGVGIDRSLPNSGTWTRQLLQTVLELIPGRFKDVRYIAAALELGRTRTGESNRGKGLHEMLQLVKDAGVGGLRIFSNHGIYSYEARAQRETMMDAPESLLGTLVQWSFRVSDFAQQS